jgi:L-fucose isomerase-like protein
MRKIRAGFVGFGEVNSPRELIVKKCLAARLALEEHGMELVYTDPVRDDPQGKDEARAREELSHQEFDFLVVCVAGWIPSHTVIDVISPFAHKPLLLWGLTAETENGRLVTTADQAGTSALRDPMEALGFRFKYVYDTPNAPYRVADKVKEFGKVARAISLLKQSRVGMIGYRDMNLHATLMDGISIRRVIGTEVEVFETLEIVQKMEGIPEKEISKVSDAILRDWRFDQPVKPEMLENGIRMYLAVMQKVKERGYQAVSLIDVDGVKKLLHFPPAMVLMLLARSPSL